MFPLNPHLSLNYCRHDFFSSQHLKTIRRKSYNPPLRIMDRHAKVQP